MVDDPISRILRKDRRYPRPAYDFVREALAFTVHHVGSRRHVTGRELLEGIRIYARMQFGPLARAVLKDWNVKSTEDFGHMVFNLVEVGEMGKTEEDSIADFVGAYAFDDVFPDEADDVRIREEE